MRRLISTLLVLVALIVVGVIVGDSIATHRTESAIASRIEQHVPGSHATVSISSSPFLVRLAVSGVVEEIHAHVTDARAGVISFDTVDVTVDGLKLSRSSLLQGSVQIVGLKQATITATLTVAGVLRTFGQALGGMAQLPSGQAASVSVSGGHIRIAFGPFAFTLPASSLVPCAGSARLTGDDIVLSCTTTTLPPALQAATSS